METRKIKWRDSRIYSYQEPLKDFTFCEIESVGYVIQEDKTKIVLARDLIDDDFRGIIVIPKENIIK